MPRCSNHKTWRRNHVHFSVFTFQLCRFHGVQKVITNWFRRLPMDVSAACSKAVFYPDLCLDSLRINMNPSVRSTHFRAKIRNRNLPNANRQRDRDVRYFVSKRSRTAHSVHFECQTNNVRDLEAAGTSIIFHTPSHAFRRLRRL
jgi:hypothetical protein